MLSLFHFNIDRQMERQTETHSPDICLYIFNHSQATTSGLLHTSAEMIEEQLCRNWVQCVQRLRSTFREWPETSPPSPIDGARQPVIKLRLCYDHVILSGDVTETRGECVILQFVCLTCRTTASHTVSYTALKCHLFIDLLLDLYFNHFLTKKKGQKENVSSFKYII